MQEFAKSHLDAPDGQPRFANSLFAFLMNQGKYNKLPADLKKVIDDNSGLEFSAMIARTQDVGDNVGRDLAIKNGNKITELEAAEVQRWKRTAGTVESEWIKDMQAKNIDGAKLVSDARALIAKHAK
ncbi:hypothetical protein D9M68_859100 [compost metagenome]